MSRLAREGTVVSGFKEHVTRPPALVSSPLRLAGGRSGFPGTGSAWQAPWGELAAVDISRYATRSLITLPLIAVAVAVITPVPAAAAGTGTAGRASFLTLSGSLRGVAATLTRNAWAVGSGTTGGLIVHWNGRAWKRAPSPSLGRFGSLSSVSAVSARDAWAVGSTSNPAATTTRTVILHWDGRSWKRVPSPSPGRSSSLSSVSAVSARDAWAVGGRLIVHWNGRSWKQVPSASLGRFGSLTGVSAVSARDAWAVGVGSGSSTEPLILRWNGTAWNRVRAPGVGAHFFPLLSGVAATSARRAWAVGDSTNCGCGPGLSLTLRWTGRAWKRVPSPTPGGGTDLLGVAVVSARGAWAVGLTGEGTSLTKTVVLRWNGASWTRVPSLAPRASSGLYAVATTPGGRAWAVGFTSNSRRGRDETLILRWNGHVWK